MAKKILILCNSSTGLNNFRGMLIDNLQLSGYEVSAIVPVADNEIELCAETDLENRGCRLIRRNINRRSINPITDLKLLNAYRSLLKVENPDLVITYTIKPNVYGGYVCRLAKIPYVINVTGLGTAFENGGMLKKIVIAMYKVACKKAKVVFFENEENRQLFIKEKIVKERQTHRLNGAGVDLEKFKMIEYPQGNKMKFLFIGRVMAEKGVDELFTAMQKLVVCGVNCELDVLGGYEENYKDKINKFEIEGWLHYHGYQTDVRPFISQCHCVVLPSWHEGMANVNLESAASGRPVISSNIPGCKEAVLGGVSGFLSEPHNAYDLYNVMKKFCSLSYEERRVMGFAGRKHMEEFFDKRNVVKDTIKKMME